MADQTKETERKVIRLVNMQNDLKVFSIPQPVVGKVDLGGHREKQGIVEMVEPEADSFTLWANDGTGEPPSIELSQRQWDAVQKLRAFRDVRERPEGPPQAGYSQRENLKKRGWLDTGAIRTERI